MRVRLYRDSFDTPWGFRLQGGKDLKQALVVQREVENNSDPCGDWGMATINLFPRRGSEPISIKVFSNTPAEGELQRGDIILSINSRDTAGLTHKQALDNIKFGGGQVELVIDRPAVSNIKPLNPTSPTRAPSNLPPVQQGPIQIPIRRKSDQSSIKFHSNMPPPVTGHTPTKITLNKYGGGTQSFGSNYGKGPAPAPYSQPYSQQPASMMTRVQDTLDSALSPPAHYYTQPQFHQQYQAPPQPPPQQQQVPPQRQYSMGQSYQPMSPKVSHDQLQLQDAQPDYIRSSDPVPEEDYEYIPVSKRKQQFVEKPQKSIQDNHYVGGEEDDDDYPNCPVWERRKLFMKDQQRRAIKHTNKGPRPFRPASSEYSSYGVDYSKVPTQPAPPKTSFKAPPPPPQQQQRPVNAAPDEPDTSFGPPAWSNTLRSSNIPKPWEREQQDYFMPAEPQRGPPPVQPKPAVKPPQPPPQRQISVRSVSNGPPAEGGPNIVHLQYNSPMGMYSQENIKETYTGQTQGSPNQTSSTVTKTKTQTQQQQPGDRDWNQSYVYRMIHGQPESRGPTGHAVPQSAPPPPPFKQQQQQHIPQPAATQMFVNMEAYGTSDF